MTLGEELDKLLENATDEQLSQFENILREVKEWDLPSSNKSENDKFWTSILFRKKLKEVLK